MAENVFCTSDFPMCKMIENIHGSSCFVLVFFTYIGKNATEMLDDFTFTRK